MSVMDQLTDLWQRCRFPQTSGLRILSLRGATVANGEVQLVDERVNFFDDRMFFLDPAKGKLYHVPCTAGQPGWYWINKYQPGEGAPFTRYGCYAYVRGIHRGQHQALRQAGNEDGRLAVIRDVNKDGVPEFDSHSPDAFDYPLGTGINIHACKGNPNYVGVWSSGCHVVQSDWKGPNWQGVMALVYGSYKSQTNFPYGVVDGKWLFDHTQRLLMGSAGDDVVKLQQFLAGKGIDPGQADGKFRRQTDIAYRSWQRKNGRTGDGICCNPDWMV